MALIKFYFIIPAFVLCLVSTATAADDQTKKSSTQQIGGLLFDVDEGVKVEQGPGGSVYLKSNKEYMQSRFNEIDERFKELEQRVSLLEAQASSNVEKKPVETKPPQTDETERRVLLS